MATLKVYSDATAVDGYVAASATIADFLPKRAEGGDTANDSFGYLQVRFKSQATTGYAEWQHGVMLYNVAAAVLPGTIISSATLTFTAYQNAVDTYASYLVLGNAPVTAYTSLTPADYALMLVNPIEHGTARISWASILKDQEYSFTLNSTALTTLNSTVLSGNVFELGLFNSWVFDNVPPNETHGTFDDNVQIYSVDWAVAAKRPYLTLTYIVGGGYATLKLTGAKADAGDTLDADLWAVEVFTST